MYDIRSAMLNIGIVFTPGKFKINLEKTWKTPGILVNLRSTDPVNNNIQKRIIFIQNKDIAAAGLLGYSYGELLP